MNECQGCGKCCHYFKDKVLYPCRFLRPDGDKYKCEIYNNRINTPTGFDDTGRQNICVLRSKSKYDFPGCPFNSKSAKPLLFTEEKWKKRKKLASLLDVGIIGN